MDLGLNGQAQAPFPIEAPAKTSARGGDNRTDFEPHGKHREQLRQASKKSSSVPARRAVTSSSQSLLTSEP